MFLNVWRPRKQGFQIPNISPTFWMKTNISATTKNNTHHGSSLTFNLTLLCNCNVAETRFESKNTMAKKKKISVRKSLSVSSKRFTKSSKKPKSKKLSKRCTNNVQKPIKLSRKMVIKRPQPRNVACKRNR
eukprot:498405_1